MKSNSHLGSFGAQSVNPVPPTALPVSVGETAAPAAASTSEPGASQTSERSDVVTSLRHPVKRKRAEGGTVALSLRLSKRDWVRLHEVALHDAVSLTELMRRGLDRVLTEKGLPPLES